MFATTLLLFVSTLVFSSALPLYFSEKEICADGMCDDRLDYAFERRANIQPGYQWDDAGGYCGSWASQRAALSKGAWISQQQFRDHTTNCGGHDSELLSCNIEEAWTNLKLDFDAFDYKSTPLPQTNAYFNWLKKQLSAGHVVAWMIMWSGQKYPIYNLTPPAGMYGHVEPVIGIQSNHPLNDTNVYDDDVVLHFTDGGTNTVHRKIVSLPGKWNGVGHAADCGLYRYCIGYPYGFGWAMKGFTSDEKSEQAIPATLHVDPWQSEPDTRSGEKPEALQGTLNVTGLTVNNNYEIYRWDTVQSAFTYSDEYKKANFSATQDTLIYIDNAAFLSNGTTYYRVVKVD